MPPRDVVMATGAVGGANYELGIRYREILSQSGVKLQLLPTTGGLENLARLRKAGVDVGFIQGGTTAVDDAADVESLGTIFYEPLWFFYRSEIGQDIQALRGRRVSIGPEGSGTRALALTLIQRFKLDSLIGALSGFEPQVSAEKLVAGEIDAAFIVTGWDSPVVQRLMNAKGIEIAGFPHADAYVALYPFLNKLVLPASVSDLLNNRPPKDVVLLAPKASLAVRAGLHPAIQHLLLDVATLVERLIVVFIPIAALLYPMFKFLPQIYDWVMQSKIRRLYDEMRSIESEIELRGEGYDSVSIDARLEQLYQRANHLSLPTSYASILYTLRSHINLVRIHLASTPKK
jgi:TRAP-type uncharacterized transport system substrate-binding protein